MEKQFTKVTKAYSTKNKLQLLILKELEKADGVLFKNKSEAENNIIQLYNNAISAYKGTAKIPKLDIHDTPTAKSLFFVDDVILIEMYNVKTDLS